MLEIKKILLNLLFPSFCVGCGAEENSGSAAIADGWLCDNCQGKIIPVVSQVCLECGKLSEHGQYHLNCRKGKALKGIIASSYFEEGPIREMIHNFKYNGVTALTEVLSDLMVNALAQNIQLTITNNQSITNNQNIEKLKIENLLDVGHCDLVISFVPMHWRRQAARGYNQSEILARAVGKKLGIDVCNLLNKPRASKQQVQLQGNARRENLRDIFIMKSDIDIKKKKIIIVDDITTTGSTLNECAKVLKSHGAKEVWGLVVSRG